MKRAMTFVLLFAGTIFTVFVFNIIMYATLPGYHAALSGALSTTSDIPVVYPDSAVEISAPAMAEDITAGPDEEDPVPLSPTVTEPEIGNESEAATEGMAEENGPMPEIISREYHEDCGTGQGYWVITYSDGSIGIE